MSPERPSASPVSEYRRIVVCADDFGMNDAVDDGILGLADLGRLSATSLLVDGPSAQRHVSALRATRLQIGLHLNLTESFGQPGVCLPLKSLIQAAYLRRLPLEQIRADIRRQLDRFQELTGRRPDYVDGHQHVHQLPGVRDQLLQALGVQADRPWIRDTARPRLAGLPWRLRLKARVIAGLGAAGLRRRAQAAGFAQNSGFLGVYDFKGGVSAYETWMSRWLALAQDGDVLMCHPARGADARDTLTDQRQAEYAVLSGARMAQWLADRRLMIAGTDACKEPLMSVSYQSLAPDFAVAGQLQPADMQALAEAGFKSVIINRPDGEAGPAQPLSADVLRAAQAAGLQARYQPVISGAMTAADVADFSRLMQELPRPVLAFCRSGARCAKLFQASQESAPHQPGG